MSDTDPCLFCEHMRLDHGPNRCNAVTFTQGGEPSADECECEGFDESDETSVDPQGYGG